jgi:hypothetical protein
MIGATGGDFFVLSELFFVGVCFSVVSTYFEEEYCDKVPGLPAWFCYYGGLPVRHQLQNA